MAFNGSSCDLCAFYHVVSQGACSFVVSICAVNLSRAKDFESRVAVVSFCTSLFFESLGQRAQHCAGGLITRSNTRPRRDMPLVPSAKHRSHYQEKYEGADTKHSSVIMG